MEELLSASGGRLVAEPFDAQLKGFDEERFHLWRVARAGPAARREGGA